MSQYLPLIGTIISGSVVVGMQMDKIKVLCEDMNKLKTDHDVLREKVYDTHTKVCIINEKITIFLKKN